MRRREALGLLAALPLAACARTRRDAGAAIELMLPSDPITLDPRFASDVYGLRASRLVHVGLVEPDAATLAPSPSLAASIEEESPRALIATIREDARFHDGSRLRARDVVATFRALGDPAVGAPGRRVVEALSSIEALDGDEGRRVRFEARRARAVLRADLETPILKADEARRARGAPLTGNGPLRVLDARPGAVTLTSAWGDGARRRLVLRTVRDEAARALRLLAGGGDEGGADLAPSCLSPPLALSLPSRGDAPRGLGAFRCASASLTMLVPNATRPPFDRPEVRRAMAMAIDRALLVSAKLGGAATLADGLIPPILPLAPRDRARHPHDPAAARAVLAPAFGARPLSLVVGNDRGRASVARAVAQMLRDAGVPIEVRTYELATLLGRLADGDFDVALMTTSEIPDPEVLRWYLHSTATPPRGANRGRIRDDEIDAHLDAALETTDAAARSRAYAALEARVHALAAVLPLWHEDHVVVTSARASTYRPSADGRWRAALDLL